MSEDASTWIPMEILWDNTVYHAQVVYTLQYICWSLLWWRAELSPCGHFRSVNFNWDVRIQENHKTLLWRRKWNKRFSISSSFNWSSIILYFFVTSGAERRITTIKTHKSIVLNKYYYLSSVKIHWVGTECFGKEYWIITLTAASTYIPWVWATCVAK